MTLTIRLAQPEDVANLYALDHRAADNPEHRAYLSREILAQNCWVAGREGQLSGYVVFNYPFFENGFVHSLYVAP